MTPQKSVIEVRINSSTHRSLAPAQEKPYFFHNQTASQKILLIIGKISLLASNLFDILYIFILYNFPNKIPQLKMLTNPNRIHKP